MHTNAEHITEDYGFHWREGGEEEKGGAKGDCVIRFSCFLTLFLNVIYSVFFRGCETTTHEPNLFLHGLGAKNGFYISQLLKKKLK